QRPDQYCVPAAINNRGEVVGDCGGRAFLWRAGKLIDLGTLGGKDSKAEGISAHGRVVGSSRVSYREQVVRSHVHTYITHLFTWSGGRLKDLGPKGYNVAS